MNLKKFQIEVRKGEPHSVIKEKKENDIGAKRCFAPIDGLKEFKPIENKYVPSSSVDIRMGSIATSDMNEAQGNNIANVNAVNSVGRSDQKEMDIDNAVKYLLENFYFISCAGNRLFYFNGRFFEDTQNLTKATKILKECLGEDCNRLTCSYREIYHQLLSESSIWVDSLEQLPTREDRVVLLDGTFDTATKDFYKNKFYPEDYMFSYLDGYYDPDRECESTYSVPFINQFCGGDMQKEQLLFEISGYTISNFRNTKACFYFLGKANAGKSTLMNWLRLIVGSDSYISIPIKELTGQFNSGELVNKKICADEDVAIESALTTKDVAFIKKVTSSDTIQTNGKYKQQGYIRPNVKLIWSGNGMFRFQTNEDLTPFIERLIIFPLDNPIPKEKRDPFIIDKLMNERTYLIRRSLEALHNLYHNQFQFTKVVDTNDYISAANVVDGIDMFVKEKCVLAENEQITSESLHEAYMTYCDEHLEYKKENINTFVKKIKKMYDIESGRTADIRMLRGISLR